jgi:hypothetical protein
MLVGFFGKWYKHAKLAGAAKALVRAIAGSDQLQDAARRQKSIERGRRYQVAKEAAGREMIGADFRARSIG